MRKFTLILLAVCIAMNLAMPAGAVDTATVYSFKDYITQWDAFNSDVEGYLYVEGTNINYPVFFYSASTAYYESRGADKQYSKNGVIFAEAQTKTGTLDKMSINTVLYGHNWTNVSATPRLNTATDIMFAQLPAFHYLDFATNNQFINYENTDGSYVFQVFAAFYTDVSYLYYNPNPSEQEFNSLMAGVKDRSLHDYALDVKWGDRIITLSTCTRALGPSDKQRFVVMGKMVPAGSAKVAVTANPDIVWPSNL